LIFKKLWQFPCNIIFQYLHIYFTKKKVWQVYQNFKPDVIYVWQAREIGYAVTKLKNKISVPIIFHQITSWAHRFNKPADYNVDFNKLGPFKILTKILVIKPIMMLMIKLAKNEKLDKKMTQVIYDKFDRIIEVSEFAKQEEAVKLGAVFKKVSVVNHAFDSELFKPFDNQSLKQELGLADNKIILYIARIDFEEKGIGYLLEAMPEIIRQSPQAKLVIIGWGFEKNVNKMKELIKDLKLFDQVLFLGKKAHADLPKYINIADVCTLPSTWADTLPRIVMEEMACGKPMVTTDAGGITDMNVDGQTGLVVPQRDAQALAQAIVKIFNNDSLRQEMGQKALERTKQKFTYEVMTKNLINIFQTEISKYK